MKMMSNDTRVERLDPKDLSDAVRVARWTQEAEASVKKSFTERLMAVDMEYRKADEAAKKQSWLFEREEQREMWYADTFMGAMVDFVEIDKEDKFNLLAQWRAYAQMHQDDIPDGPAGEKKGPEALRLAQYIVNELLEFLCQAVRAESASAMQKKTAQQRLAKLAAEKIEEGKADAVKGTVARMVGANMDLLGVGYLAIMLDDLRAKLAPALWAGMPSYSTMVQAVTEAAGAQGDQVKPALSKLCALAAMWAADAAQRLPEKKAPAAPAVATGQEVKLSCDREQPLFEGYGGCFKCGSKYHRREDHKDSADGGQKGGGNNNNNSGGGGGKGGKHCKNCGRNNHWTDKCREAVCTKCGAKGHWGSNCKVGRNAKDEAGKAKTKEPMAPATSTQGESP